MMVNKDWIATVAAAVVIGMAASSLVLISGVGPSSSICQPSPLIADETTSSGVPVYRFGEQLRYTTCVKNEGVDIVVTRWMDKYDPLSGVADEGPLHEPSQFTLLREDVFPVSGPREASDIPVAVELDGSVDVPGHYKLRTTNCYKPNFMAERCNITETELFYLAEPGGDLP